MGATTAPFQHVLSTRARCECVVRILQSIIDKDFDVIVVSIDGVGVYDLISRKAMFEGLLNGGWRKYSLVRPLVPHLSVGG